MLIMAQVEEEIVNLDSIEVIFLEDADYKAKGRFGVLNRSVNGRSLLLGWYESEERAKEVFRGIFEEYRIPGKRTYKMPEE